MLRAGKGGAASREEGGAGMQGRPICGAGGRHDDWSTGVHTLAALHNASCDRERKRTERHIVSGERTAVVDRVVRCRGAGERGSARGARAAIRLLQAYG